MKTYVGKRNADGCSVLVREGSHARPLPLRLTLFNHSPTGFEWGYQGSGPAQLALAILADALHDDERAVRLHQHYKRAVICKLPREAWRIEEREVREWIERYKRDDDDDPS
jgi:Family of unknown function (DUF6166)